MTEGRILRQTGGFYYVETEDGIAECRARGRFRKTQETPLVGDRVTIEAGEAGLGYVTAIHPRRNELVRPPVANIDQLLVILSIVDPPPNLLVVDKLLAIAAYKEIAAVIIVTKADLGETEGLCTRYRQAGYPVHCINSLADSPTEIAALLEGKTSVLTGNTGAGKSTLLNAIAPGLSLATGETSKKLGRGRHTTRVTELFAVAGGWIADTPGFSSLETAQFERIRKEQLEDCFPEFAPHLGKCRFTGCSHTKEQGCAVLAAVAAGEISTSRHENYCIMYDEARQIKDWEIEG